MQLGNLKRRREAREQKAKPVESVRGAPLFKSRKIAHQAQERIYPSTMSEKFRGAAKPQLYKPELKEGAYGAMFPHPLAETSRSLENDKPKLVNPVSSDQQQTIPRTDSWQTVLTREDSLSSDNGLPSEDDIDFLFNESFDVNTAIRNVVNGDLKSSLSCPDSIPLY